MAPLLAAVLVACSPQPEPRTVSDFMDDGFAREGVLTRCIENREVTLTDEECANARRAATAVALEAERARAPGLEQQSGSADVAANTAAARWRLEVAAAEPPPNEIVIAEPELQIDLGDVARPLRDQTAPR